jgi:hypothetical protein
MIHRGRDGRRQEFDKGKMAALDKNYERRVACGGKGLPSCEEVGAMKSIVWATLMR